TCHYEKFRAKFTRAKIVKAGCLLWFCAGLICILPMLHYALKLPIFNINISLLEDREYKRKDYYLEYVLHVLHGTLILWMIWAYSKCIIHMKYASKRILPGVMGTLMAVHQRRNFRICINYLLITVLFIILVVTWLMFELIGSTWITVCSKKLAYIANSTTPALIFLTTNSSIKRDTAAVISSYRNSIFESVSKIKDWKLRSPSNVGTLE
uniref:Uncharacterized protein n=1 Tax=Romanomermis culicivorax TaxID=13658 RepID=A0A915KJN1_ROMCU